MGKATLIGVVAMMLISTMMLYNMQLVSRETDRRQFSHMKDEVARELALTGRKFILAHWVESGGTSASAPFTQIERDGGTIEVTSFTLDASVLDFTIRAEYGGAIHEVRSKYRWNSYAVNPLQIKATGLHLEVSPLAEMNIESITLDDQSIQEVNNVLIDELQMAESLDDLDMGIDQLQGELESKLSESGNGDIDIEIIDQAAREYLDQQNGLFFPDQVQQAINSYMADNPSVVQTLELASLLNVPTVLSNPEKEIYKITENFELTESFSGSGILIVQGSLIVPPGIDFNWEGLVIVQPPSSDLHAQIDFSGNVTLDGSLIALQEAIPNSGHMDVTVFRDVSGNWTSPYGNESLIWGWNWCLYHLHDFTAAYGNSVRFYAASSANRINETEVRFNSTLKNIGKNNDYFLRIKNPEAHGRGILTMEVDGRPNVSAPIAAGFDPEYVTEADVHQSQTFKGNDLEWLHLDIGRLSSLKKLWDDTDNPFPGCTLEGGTSGPLCVGEDYERRGALTLQLYQKEDFADKMVYEASLYWHRREDEEEEFEEEMTELIDELNSTETGLSITFGDNVTFSNNPAAIASLGVFGGLPLGVTQIGTWHSVVEAE